MTFEVIEPGQDGAGYIPEYEILNSLSSIALPEVDWYN
jgi:hypothetical protein